MSTAKRAYDLLRGYVNREYDRIRGVELAEAERELYQSQDSPLPPRTIAVRPTPAPPAGSREDRARRVLGVSVGATFDDIRRAFERLNRRADPGNFPVASIERDQAGEIQRRVQWAYSVLTDHVDTMEKRFRSLEIE